MSQDNKFKDLKDYELFKDLPETVSKELAAKVELVSLKNDEVLFRKGDPGDALYLLQSGWVKMVSEDAEGKEVVLNEVGPGSTIGEIAMIDMEPRSAGVIAMSDVELLKLGSEDFLNVLYQQPKLGLHIIHSVSKSLRFANTYLENTIFWSQRIAEGDYNFAQEQVQKAQSGVFESSSPDEDRANRLLGTFFRMVEDIRAREDGLKKELDELIIVIDQAKREKSVDDVTSSGFFKSLKTQSKKMRRDAEKGDED
ncbi:MAG: Crp/Fnr family transcriptional regulator [Chloroflexi bacterium]|nr:Crp/Fnr family transcriptional regulator [Chloroflexota bacterium]